MNEGVKMRETNFTISAGEAEVLVKFGSSTQPHGAYYIVLCVPNRPQSIILLYCIQLPVEINIVKQSLVFKICTSN